MAKKITVVFYPNTARVFKGDYQHKGEEPFIVDPEELPLGVPLQYWKLIDGKIATPGYTQKVVPEPVFEEIKPIINQTIINGVTEEYVDSKLSSILTDFHQQLFEINKSEKSSLTELKQDYTNKCLDLAKQIVQENNHLKRCIELDSLKKQNNAINELDIQLSEKIEGLKKEFQFEIGMLELGLKEAKCIQPQKLIKKDYSLAKIVGISALVNIILHFLLR